MKYIEIAKSYIVWELDDKFSKIRRVLEEHGFDLNKKIEMQDMGNKDFISFAQED